MIHSVKKILVKISIIKTLKLLRSYEHASERGKSN